MLIVARPVGPPRPPRRTGRARRRCPWRWSRHESSPPWTVARRFPCAARPLRSCSPPA